MKIIIICLFVSLAFAQQQQPDPNNRALAETLEKRGDALLENGKKTLQEIHQSGFHHLADQFENQLVQVEALMLSLKTQLADKNKQYEPHHISVIEEELLHLENRISEEIAIINNIRNHQQRGFDAKQLVNIGQVLVKQAKDHLAAHANTSEASDIKREIEAIESLIKQIEAKPEETDLRKYEEQLARHEKTLFQLMEKTIHRSPVL